MKEYSLHLLGVPKVIKLGDVSTRFRSKRVLALLAYLIGNRRNIARSELVELIWPDKSEQQGRANLRWALTIVTQLLSPEMVERTRSAVRFVQPPTWDVDLLTFEQAFADRDLETLGSALSQINGEYLTGFYFDESAEFETWLVAEREKWRRSVRDGLEFMITHYYESGDHAAALTYAKKLLELDEWVEVAHRWVIELYARLGMFEEAATQYERCRKILAEELGTEPTIETTALFDRVQRAGSETRLHLPAQPTRFIGRNTEISQIRQLLAKDEVRLLTLLGPGGIGKTRLAIRAAQDSANIFMDGTIFVPLDGLETSEQIPQALVTALHDAEVLTDIQGTTPSIEYLRQHLHNKELLLVLDNFEHLVDGIMPVLDILVYAPRIKMLTTSRERLHVQWEYVLEVEGLPLQAAMTLFIQGAERARADFSFDSRNEPFIMHICHLTDGMPLAIELASAWIRLETCATIAAQIQTNLDFLSTTQRDVPERHRSVRAAFDYSWQLLDETERETLHQLSVFRGTFSSEAARTLCQSSWPLLASLVDKSLLEQQTIQDDSGVTIRYRMHMLLRQFAADLVDEASLTETRNLHADYYSGFLHKHTERIMVGDQETLNAIQLEMSNIRAAWNWAVTQRRPENIAAGCEALGYFFDMRCNWHEGHHLFAKTLAMLRQLSAESPLSDELTLLTGTLQMVVANFCSRLLLHADAFSLLDEAYALIGPLNNREIELFIDFIKARTLTNSGNWHDACLLYEQGIAGSEAINYKAGMARCYANLSIIYSERGHFERSVETAKIATQLFEEIGDQRGVATGLTVQATVLIVSKRSDQCVALLKRVYDIAIAIDSAEMLAAHHHAMALWQFVQAKWEEGINLLVRARKLYEKFGNVADAAQMKLYHAQVELMIHRNLSEAQMLCRQALEIGQQFGNSFIEAWALNLQGFVWLLEGQVDSAESIFKQAIELARPIESDAQMLFSLAGLASCYQTSHPHFAAQLADLVQNHPAVTFGVAANVYPLELPEPTQAITLEQALTSDIIGLQQ